MNVNFVILLTTYKHLYTIVGHIAEWNVQNIFLDSFQTSA